MILRSGNSPWFMYRKEKEMTYHDEEGGGHCAFLVMTKGENGNWNIVFNFHHSYIQYDEKENPPLIFYHDDLNHVLHDGFSINWELDFLYTITGKDKESNIFRRFPPSTNIIYAVESCVDVQFQDVGNISTSDIDITSNRQGDKFTIQLSDAERKKVGTFTMDIVDMASYKELCSTHKVSSHINNWFPSMCEPTLVYNTNYGSQLLVEGLHTGNQVFEKNNAIPPTMVRRFPTFSTKYRWKPIIEEGQTPTIEVALTPLDNGDYPDEYLQIHLTNLPKMSYSPIELFPPDEKDILNINLKWETVYGGFPRTYNKGKIDSKSDQKFFCKSPLLNYDSTKYDEWLPPVESNHIEKVLENICTENEKALIWSNQELKRLQRQRVKALTGYDSVSIPKALPRGIDPSDIF